MRHPDPLQHKSRLHQVTRAGSHAWVIRSGETGNDYTVIKMDSGRYACSCPWGQYRPDSSDGAACSHVLAAIAATQAADSRTIRAHGDLDSARRQHRHILDIGDGLLLTTRKG